MSRNKKCSSMYKGKKFDKYHRKRFFTIPFYFSQLWSTKWNCEIISFPYRCQYPPPLPAMWKSFTGKGGGGISNNDFTFSIFFS